MFYFFYIISLFTLVIDDFMIFSTYTIFLILLTVLQINSSALTRFPNYQFFAPADPHANFSF